MKWQIKVKLAASLGIAETRTVEVDATGEADALVNAAIKLEDLRIARWSLESVSEMSS